MLELETFLQYTISLVVEHDTMLHGKKSLSINKICKNINVLECNII